MRKSLPSITHFGAMMGSRRGMTVTHFPSQEVITRIKSMSSKRLELMCLIMLGKAITHAFLRTARQDLERVTP